MESYKVHGGGPRPLPKLLIVGVSAGIVIHLAALVVLVTAAPSGPWISPFGPSPALAPEFAGVLYSSVEPAYLKPLHLTHNYHFSSNDVERPTISFEVILKDAQGKTIDTVQFPQKSANGWVRHRQVMLAQNLGGDSPLMMGRPGERIAAPGRELKRVTVWERGDDGFRLKTTPMHLLPENQPADKPSKWSQVLAKSYMRYLCNKHGAASASLIRHSRAPIVPVVLPILRGGGAVPPGLLDEEMKANFGEYRVEN